VARILVVDDDEKLRLLYQERLEEEGYEVILAADGGEALRRAQEDKPDVVVLDIAMPVMDGIDALIRILEHDNKLPVILNTAYGSYKENFMTWAARAYVVKSGDLSELLERIREALEVPRPGEAPG